MLYSALEGGRVFLIIVNNEIACVGTAYGKGQAAMLQRSQHGEDSRKLEELMKQRPEQLQFLTEKVSPSSRLNRGSPAY